VGQMWKGESVRREGAEKNPWCTEVSAVPTKH
jgi:hypothetical protein